MEFRLKLYLFHFYFDHRKTSLIYTKKNMKTIKDLKAYISKQFEIDGEFYLTCNDYYLPYSEDIRVLKEDDIVIVVPRIEERPRSVTPPKKIKKDKKKEKEVRVSPVKKKMEEDEVIVKRKKTEDEDLEMAVDEVEIDEVDHSTKTTETKTKNETWHTVAREYTRKRKIDLLPISTSPNIVKSIIVHDNLPNGLDSKPPTQTSSSSESEVSINTTSNNVNPESVASEVESTTKCKRKRKRIRKRKGSLPLEPAPNIVVPVAPIIGTPSLHIRFDELNVNVKYELEEKETEAIELKDEKVDESNEKEAELIELGEEKNDYVVNYEELCKSEIVNFPLMQDRNPNVDEVIAFKRFRLSETFTPEISNYIVGRVRNFNADTKEVIVKVLEGLDQCKDPEGRFFWNEDVEEEERSLNRDEKKFVWTDLLERRLLYP